MRHYRRQLHTLCTQLPQPRLCLRGRIIPAGADAEQFTRPVAGQKDAAINFVGIVDMQLSCESIDVVFDRARPNSDGHANVSIVEPLGQKIENFDFSRRNVNRTRPRCAGMGTPQKFWAGTARWCGAFASSRALLRPFGAIIGLQSYASGIRSSKGRSGSRGTGWSANKFQLQSVMNTDIRSNSLRSDVRGGI